MPHLVSPVGSDNSGLQDRWKVTSGTNSLGREGALAVEEDQEYRAPVIAPRPIAPTKAQLDEHLPLHLHYRSWCPHCVFGKGHSSHHRRGEDGLRDEPTIHLDYCFFSSKTADLDDEEENESSVKVLVMYDDQLDALWALRVAKKGALPEVVKWCCDKLEDSGYNGVRLAMKSDQENAILDLKRAISVHRLGETTPLLSPVRCSTANGRMENAVKRFQWQLRVLKKYFEDSVKAYMMPDNPLLSWLIPWVTESMNKFRVGDDGKTPYERATGHTCKHPVYGFGESVIWQLPPNKSDRDKLDGEFRDGIFLGVIWRSTEFLIGTAEGIFKTHTVKQRPHESAYDRKCLEYIKVVYSDFVLEGGQNHWSNCKVRRSCRSTSAGQSHRGCSSDWC